MVWFPTVATLTLTGSNSYIESEKDFILNCLTDETPAITRAFFYKDNEEIKLLQYQAGNCYEVPTKCSISNMCDCNTTSYTLTFNAVIKTQSVLFGCRVQFQNTPIWRNSTLELFLPSK